jgi:cytochrome o ubiquinol oxidase subunit 2
MPSGDARPHARGAAARVALAAAATGTALVLAGCGAGPWEPRGPVGIAEKTILIDASVIMLAIIVPTMIGTLAFAWWFRASNTKATYRPDWAFSGRIEMVVWSIPLLTIIFLGGIAWVSAHDLDPAVPLAADKKPIEIRAVSLDWKWLFIYPDQHVATINQLVIPAGTPVHFALTSSSVWNSFFISQLGSMIYTMKGMATQLNLQADQEGSYHGLSTHFSGDGFSDMDFETRAVSPDAFGAWVTQTKGSGPKLDDGIYRDLVKQSQAEPPRTFSDADGSLFDRIVSGQLPAGPGPAGGPAPDVKPKGGS